MLQTMMAFAHSLERLRCHLSLPVVPLTEQNRIKNERILRKRKILQLFYCILFLSVVFLVYKVSLLACSHGAAACVKQPFRGGLYLYLLLCRGCLWIP